MSDVCGLRCDVTFRSDSAPLLDQFCRVLVETSATTVLNADESVAFGDAIGEFEKDGADSTLSIMPPITGLEQCSSTALRKEIIRSIEEPGTENTQVLEMHGYKSGSRITAALIGAAKKSMVHFDTMLQDVEDVGIANGHMVRP